MKRFIIAFAVVASVLLVPAPTNADAATQCRNPLAKTLVKAGFRNEALRQAWAIAMRESRGQNLNESSRWYSGALGIFQIQTSVWSSQRWWSRSKMLTPKKQARIVYKKFYLVTGWRHWGLTRYGTLDATYYSGWSSWQHEAWIMRPFRQFYAQFPMECMRR